MKGEQGFALVLTLLVTTLLIALVAEFTSEVFVDTSARHAYVAGEKASLLAESGIAGGIRLLQLSLKGQSYTSLSDPWAKPLKLSDDRGELQLTIEDESGKLNLNGFPENGNLTGDYTVEVAGRLLQKLKLNNSSDLVDALADWRDLNDYPHPGGAETTYYSSLKPPYAAKSGPLNSVEELALVKGFPGEPMTRLLPLVTVYQDQGTININTAPKEIIASLDERITDDLADRVVEYRSATPFKVPAGLLSVPGFETIATGLMTRIGVKGTVFRLRAEGRVQEVGRVIEAVVRISGNQAQTIYWREY